MIEITCELVIGTGSAKKLVVSPDGVSNGHWLIRRDAIASAVSTAGALRRELGLNLEVDFPIEAVTESTRRTKRARQMKKWLNDPAEGWTFRRTDVTTGSNDGEGPEVVLFAAEIGRDAVDDESYHTVIGVSRFYADYFSFTEMVALDALDVESPLRTPDGVVVIMPVALHFYPQEAVDLAIAGRSA